MAQWGDAPPPAVDVLTVEGTTVPVVNELPGRIAATRVSEVRARVSGILQERVFEQGTLVGKGEVLFRIDPQLFEVRVASAEAALQRAEATRDNAAIELERQESLRDRKVNSVAQYERASVALAQAEADVAAARAALEEARIRLGYTDVTAPITGIIGGALVTEGALVTADGPQNMALIQKVDPVYADFTQSSAELFALKRAVEQRKLRSPVPGEARVRLVLDDGTLYPHPGRLLFSSASVDPGTGQVTLRAEFPNPGRDLLPGLYVRVRIEQAVRQDAIAVPQRAIVRSAEGEPQVYVVDEGVAQLREVTLGEAIGSDWVVETGLDDGEAVVVNGTMKVQPGGKVTPQPWQPNAADEETETLAEATNTPGVR